MGTTQSLQTKSYLWSTLEISKGTQTNKAVVLLLEDVRSMIAAEMNVDTSKFTNVQALKKKSLYTNHKSKIVARQDVTRLLLEANDDKFSFQKVAFITRIAFA